VFSRPKVASTKIKSQRCFFKFFSKNSLKTLWFEGFHVGFVFSCRNSNSRFRNPMEQERTLIADVLFLSSERSLESSRPTWLRRRRELSRERKSNRIHIAHLLFFVSIVLLFTRSWCARRLEQGPSLREDVGFWNFKQPRQRQAKKSQHWCKEQRWFLTFGLATFGRENT
jgi:hypothetical protein